MIIYPIAVGRRNILFIQPDGTYILGTYNLPKNSWTFQRVLLRRLTGVLLSLVIILLLSILTLTCPTTA